MTKPTREYSLAQEKAVAKMLEGSVVPNSGATGFSKGDVISKDRNLLLECKTKVKPQKSVPIKLEWLKEIRQEAKIEGLTGAVVIDFGEERKSEINQYIVMSIQDFNKREELIRAGVI